MVLHLVTILTLFSMAVACNDYQFEFTAVDDVGDNAKTDTPTIEVGTAGRNNGADGVNINQTDRDDLELTDENAIATLSKSFIANPLRNNTVIVDFQQPVIDKTLTMEADVINNHKKFKQLSYPKHRTQHEQTGSDGEYVEESFAQNEKGVLDILLVVDNSASMRRAQSQLAKKLTSLLGFLSESNWQVAITTTDRRDCIRNIITKDIPNYEEEYRNTIVSLGTEGSMFEEAVLMANRALRGECNGVTSSWLREESSLAIIMVTDEDHQCYIWTKNTPKPDYEFCYDDDDDKHAVQVEKLYRSMDDLYDYLKEIREPQVTAKIYGILNPADRDGKNSHSGSLRFKSWREKVNNSRAGAAFFDEMHSIFARDYNPLLQDISADISVILKDQFVLKHAPDHDSLHVSISHNGETRVLQAGEYTLANATLTLAEAPAEGAAIDVTYVHERRPYLTEFALPHLPVEESVAVSFIVDGQRQEVTDSAYTLTDRTLTFLTTPPSGALVVIDYKESIALKSTFPLSAGRISNLEVQVNEQLVHDYVIQDKTNTLVFPAHALPPEKAIIEVFYRTILRNILAYQVDIHPRLRAGGLSCSTATNELINCHHERSDTDVDMIVFAKNDFQIGRLITVKQVLDVTTNDIKLRTDYLPQSLVLKLEGHICLAANLIVVDETVILHSDTALDGCPVLRRKSGSIELTYQHVEMHQTFAIDKSFFDAHMYEYAYWEIYVNDVEVEDFKIEKYTITFDRLLPPAAQVRVKVFLY